MWGCAARPAVRGGAPSLSSVAELVGGCGTTGGSRQQSSGEPTRMSNQRWDSLCDGRRPGRRSATLRSCPMSCWRPAYLPTPHRPRRRRTRPFPWSRGRRLPPLPTPLPPPCVARTLLKASHRLARPQPQPHVQVGVCAAAVFVALAARHVCRKTQSANSPPELSDAGALAGAISEALQPGNQQPRGRIRVEISPMVRAGRGVELAGGGEVPLAA